MSGDYDPAYLCKVIEYLHSARSLVATKDRRSILGAKGEKCYERYLAEAGLKACEVKSNAGGMNWDRVVEPHSRASVYDLFRSTRYLVECKNEAKWDRHHVMAFLNAAEKCQTDLVLFCTAVVPNDRFRDELVRIYQNTQTLAVVLGPDEGAIQEELNTPAPMFLQELIRYLHDNSARWDPDAFRDYISPQTLPEDLKDVRTDHRVVAHYEHYVQRLILWLSQAKCLLCVNQAAPYNWIFPCVSQEGIRAEMTRYSQFLADHASQKILILRITEIEDLLELTDPVRWVEQMHSVSWPHWLKECQELELVPRRAAVVYEHERARAAVGILQRFLGYHHPVDSAVYRVVPPRLRRDPRREAVIFDTTEGWMRVEIEVQEDMPPQVVVQVHRPDREVHINEWLHSYAQCLSPGSRRAREGKLVALVDYMRQKLEGTLTGQLPARRKSRKRKSSASKRQGDQHHTSNSASAGIHEFYDAYAEKYERFEQAAIDKAQVAPLLHTIRKRERELLEAAKGQSVLYFAAGSGSDMEKLCGLGANVVGVDFSLKMLRLNMSRLNQSGIRPRLVDGASDSRVGVVNEPVLVHSDIRDLSFGRDEFDHVFCYCTLPLMGKDVRTVLRRLLNWARRGAVSVYNRKCMPDLAQYYRDFGFASRLTRWGVALEGGFHYYCVEPKVMEGEIRKIRRLEVEEVGLGRIYRWT